MKSILFNPKYQIESIFDNQISEQNTPVKTERSKAEKQAEVIRIEGLFSAKSSEFRVKKQAGQISVEYLQEYYDYCRKLNENLRKLDHPCDSLYKKILKSINDKHDLIQKMEADQNRESAFSQQNYQTLKELGAIRRTKNR